MTYKSKMRRTLAVLATGIALGGMTAQAGMYQMASNYVAGTVAPYNSGGGVPAGALLTLNTNTSTNVTLSWYGMQGWYVVEGSTNLTDYVKLGSVKASDFATTATVTNPFGAMSASFRLSQTNSFAGSGACAGCHGDKYTEYQGTGHATALSLIMDANGNFTGHANASCVKCHTVGYGQPTGFTNLATTPQLANVGCENCHGPAGWHKDSDHYTIHPAVSIDPTICGSCHQGSHHPEYTEYALSAHAAPAHSSSTSCGPCHSAALRMTMLNEYNDMMAGRPHAVTWPSTTEINAWTAACATCHDPHSAQLAGQLRNPMFSTNFYTMPSVADGNYNTTFDSYYDPNIQICGQCHNSRGARWDGLKYAVMTTNVVSGPVTNTVYVNLYTTNTFTQVFTNSSGVPYLTNTYTQVYVSGRTNATVVTMVTNTARYTGLTNSVDYSRGPHHSHQYNILIGNVQDGYLPVKTHSHTRIANQCVACHVPSYAVNSSTNNSGHTFAVDVKGCALAGCHTSYSEDALHLKIEDLQEQESNSITSLVSLLNQWATNKAPALLGATDYSKSLENSWEYSTKGELATGSKSGPVATNQVKLPDAIRKARYNLYMVYNDSSLGVHNPTYTKFLLADAETNVLSQLSDMPALFKASTVLGDAPLAVNFTNLSASATGGTWTFGDGGTTNVLNPTYVYSTPGTYSVTFTESGGSTLTRTAYIVVREKPTLNFTSDVVTGTAPLTVTFTNTSTGTSSVDWYRYQFNTADSGSRLDTPATVVSYTYTNAGTYSVSLRATVYGGSSTSTLTKNNYIIVNPAP
jgi:PKD repeat protein